MNISVYLPDQLKARFDAYVKDQNTSRNAAIRKAVELLLKQEKKNEWGNWINQLEPNTDFPNIEDIRSDLKSPREDFFE